MRYGLAAQPCCPAAALHTFLRAICRYHALRSTAAPSAAHLCAGRSGIGSGGGAAAFVATLFSTNMRSGATIRMRDRDIGVAVAKRLAAARILCVYHNGSCASAAACVRIAELAIEHLSRIFASFCSLRTSALSSFSLRSFQVCCYHFLFILFS